MVHASYPATVQLQSILVRASEDPDFRRLVRNTTSNPNEYVFRSIATQLQPVRKDTLAYLGRSVDGMRTLARLRQRDTVLDHELQGAGRSYVTFKVGDLVAVFFAVLIPAMICGFLVAAVVFRRIKIPTCRRRPLPDLHSPPELHLRHPVASRGDSSWSHEMVKMWRSHDPAIL